MLASGLDIDLVGSEWVIVWKECVLCPETLAESKLLRIVERTVRSIVYNAVAS